MNRAAASFLIPFASAVLAATAFAQTTPATTVLKSAPNSSTASARLSHVQITVLPNSIDSSCPVGMRAQPGIGPGMVVVVTGDTSVSQKLNLQLTNPDGEGVITHAQITVHGLTAHPRISPAATDNAAPFTIAKDVDLALTVAPGADASTNMLFKGFTSVRWIDLDSLTYADGSTWRSSPQHACQITPDRMMLVASH